LENGRILCAHVWRLREPQFVISKVTLPAVDLEVGGS
jgi:hypothetical protein